MPVYAEPGFSVALPDWLSFRLQDCESYSTLCGQGLSEMDFGWWEDAPQPTLWLLEVKDYGHLAPEEQLPEHLIPKLVAKATDTLLLLAAAWIPTGRGQDIARWLPEPCRSFPAAPKRLKLVFALRLPPERRALVPALKDKVNQQLRGRIGLFDLKQVILVDHETAARMGLPITPAPA